MPSSPIEESLTGSGVRELVTRHLANAEAIATELRNLKAASDADLTWDATFGAMDHISNAIQEASGAPALMTVAHPDADVRTAAEEGDPKITAFVTALFLDADIASVLQRAAKRFQNLDVTRNKFVTETLRDFRRNGLSLPPEKQEQLRAINDELTRCGQAFDKNLAEATASIEVTPEQLDGLPETYITSHHADANGRIRITTDNPDYVPFMQYAKDRQAARELNILSKNRAKDLNLPLLDTLLKLREEKAHLLGYATWADYVLEPRMAKNAKRVAEFLEEIGAGIKPGIEREIAIYKETAAKLGILKDGTISGSDSSFVDEMTKRETFAINSQDVSAYFEITSVINGLLNVAGRLFQIQFTEIQKPTWHEDVRVLRVSNLDEFVLGTLYLDLHPRENKYKHAAVFGLREAVRLPDGTRREAECALVCNLVKSGAAPSLLTHNEVITLFHEFGHALHHLFSDTSLVSFAGTNVARDFVEAPSQALEEFAWQREALDLFAKHHVTGEHIPDELYAKMLRARGFGRATATAQQVFYAALDQAYHTRASGFDTTEVMEELYAKYVPYAFVEGTHFQGTFGHLVGYDAGYYGYQWALAIARDLLTRFEREGMMNTETATTYRKEILEKGGSEDESALVEHFLGRPFSTEAYTRFLSGKTIAQ